MRNYFKLLTLKYRNHGEPGPVNGDMYAFGKDHDSLMYWVNKANQQLIIDEPAFTWTFTYPTDPVYTYWLLNQTNFVKMLNQDAQLFWLNTRLNTDPLAITPQLTEETYVAAQGSPRQHFPTDLGTDGQRLRTGETKEAGAALNYIGKLFFLTSNATFFALWQALKKGSITVKQALTETNALVQSLSHGS